MANYPKPIKGNLQPKNNLIDFCKKEKSFFACKKPNFTTTQNNLPDFPTQWLMHRCRADDANRQTNTRLPTQKQEQMWLVATESNSFSWGLNLECWTLSVGASDKCKVVFLVRIFYKVPQSCVNLCVCVCVGTLGVFGFWNWDYFASRKTLTSQTQYPGSARAASTQCLQNN